MSLEVTSSVGSKLISMAAEKYLAWKSQNYCLELLYFMCWKDSLITCASFLKFCLYVYSPSFSEELVSSR